MLFVERMVHTKCIGVLATPVSTTSPSVPMDTVDKVQTLPEMSACELNMTRMRVRFSLK
jgi:hypothetical protein